MVQVFKTLIKVVLYGELVFLLIADILLLILYWKLSK